MTTRRPMRRGMTLLEVMVALLVTALVVGLGYATLGSAMDTQDRTSAVRDAATSQAAARALLTDALRHVVDGRAIDSEGWHATPATDGTTARLAFVSRGLVSPLGASGRWQVVVAPHEGALWLSAESLDAAAPRLAVRLPNTTAMRLRFRSRTDAGWVSRWDDATRVPLAIEVQWLDAAGQPVGAPFVARTAPVGDA
mgnify:CR=1 FL=1